MDLSDILSLDKLLCQTELLKKKGFQPGFDGMTADAVCLWMQVNGSRLLQELLSGAYRPMPAIGFRTAKTNGGYRQLANLTAVDRVIQLCILETLSEKLESVFSPYSYAFRKGRGTGEALKQYCLYAEQYAYASKLDPVACFDTMDHDVLGEAVRQHIAPGKRLWELLCQYDCFDFMIKSEDLVFDKRTRQPPRNEINALLSFGNTVLYNIIAFKINQSPLDIRIGYLHATNGFRLESLQLDIAEIFKPLIVDRAIFSLCNLRAILPEHFEHEENGAVYLNQAGKRIFLRAIYDKLDTGLTINQRFFTYQMLIDEEMRKLVRYFRKDEPYKAYRQVQ